MIDKEVVGLLIGVALAAAFVATLVHIHLHPDRHGWLELTSKPETPPAGMGGGDAERTSTS